LCAFQEGTIGHDLVVKPVPASVQQHLDQPRLSKHGVDDEMFLDEDGEDIQEDIAVETGFPLRRVQSANGSELKPQQHIVYRRSSRQNEEPEFSDYGTNTNSNFILVSPCIFYNSLFTSQQNALHFHFYYLFINPYICFGLYKAIFRGLINY
jgi:hypothetical protein